MKTYHKIETLFLRDMNGTKKLVPGAYRNSMVEYLKDLTWEFTEKVDGTNIRVHWDGYRVTFGGRTDSAQIPVHLMNKLVEKFSGPETEQIFETLFGENQATLFGEGYGPKIQTGGGLYGPEADFILFDVTKNDVFMDRGAVGWVAEALGIQTVPVVLYGTLKDGVRFASQPQKSRLGNQEHEMEGLVARPLHNIFDNRGERVIVKIKYNDFKDIDVSGWLDA